MTHEPNHITLALDALGLEEIPTNALLRVSLTNGQGLAGTFKAVSGLSGFYAINNGGSESPTFFHITSVVAASASLPPR